MMFGICQSFNSALQKSAIALSQAPSAEANSRGEVVTSLKVTTGLENANPFLEARDRY